MGHRRVIHSFFVFRHGDRAPMTTTLVQEGAKQEIDDYWKSIVPTTEQLENLEKRFPVERNNEKFMDSPSELSVGSRLTKRGLEQLRSIGDMLRRHFAGQKLTPRQVEGFCTPYSRTLQSMQSLLSGLFPNGFENETPSLQMRPYVSEMLPPITNVNSIGKFWNILVKESEGKTGFTAWSIQKQIEASLAQLGISASDFLKALYVFDALVCSQDHGYVSKLVIPENETPRMLETFKSLCHNVYTTVFSEPQYAREGPGQLLNAIIDKAKTSLESFKGDMKFTAYSGHDNVVLPILTVFGYQFDDGWLPYGSNVLIEVSEISSSNEDSSSPQAAVTILVNGAPAKLDDRLGSGVDIPFEKFESFCRDLMQ